MKSRMMFRETGGASRYRTTSSTPAWGWGLFVTVVLVALLGWANQMDTAAEHDAVAVATAMAQAERRVREELLDTVAAARAQGRRDALEELRADPRVCLAMKGGR